MFWNYTCTLLQVCKPQLTKMATRWGIAGAGNISNSFLSAMTALPSEEHVVMAVAARELERANKFAEKFNIRKAYGSYEELAKDPNVEVVYIGVIHPFHLDTCKLMLNNGKHVLCEKPLTLNYNHTKQLIDIATEKKLFLMEGIWSRCFPAYEALKNEIDSGNLGEIYQVMASLGMPIAQVERLKSKELGGGGLLDIGIYTLQLAHLVFGPSFPECIKAQGVLNSNGVDTSVSMSLMYEGGKTATLCTHCKVLLPNEAFIVGTKGTFKIVGPFWCPTEIEINGTKKTFPLPKGSVEVKHEQTMGMAYEATEVRDCLIKGLLESSKVTHDDSLKLAQIEDEIRRQIGVIYEADRTCCLCD